MTNDIALILEKYEGQETGTLLANPALERDIAIIGQVFQTSEGEEQKAARHFLLRILGEIDVKMDELNSEKANEEANYNHIKRMSDACIAYMKPKGRKG